MEKEIFLQPGIRVVRIERQRFPACRFAGIRYKNSDRRDGTFSHLWGEWFQTGRFDALEALQTPEFRAAFPDAGAYWALMRSNSGAPEDFEYWIGMFLPPDAAADGVETLPFPASEAAVCWLKGPEEELSPLEGQCFAFLRGEGFEPAAGAYFFERYACPRFTTPDEDGGVILDLGFFTEGRAG